MYKTKEIYQTKTVKPTKYEQKLLVIYFSQFQTPKIFLNHFICPQGVKNDPLKGSKSSKITKLLLFQLIYKF